MFSDILYSYGSSNGRYTILIGEFNKSIDMFVSIYAPNSGLNLEFFSSLLNKVSNLRDQYKADNIFLLGDLNVVLSSGVGINRKTTKSEKTLVRKLEVLLASLDIKPFHHNGDTKHTWCRGSTLSTLDYIIGPLHLVNLNPGIKVIWGIDKSDHAALLTDIEFDLDRGRGMFRTNTSFFNSPEFRADFERACLIDFYG